MAEISVEHLCKAFADFTAVRDSTFTVRNGEFFCLLGPSGCGKTTTLRMIAGLELPTSGRILLGGEDVTQKRASQRDIAFVFQLFALYPHLTVRANIAYPLRSQGMMRKDVQTRVEEAARILRIEHLLDRSVSGLSSGDRQRVAVGRAIVREPLAFLLDEPLGALDAEFRDVMCGELRALHDRLRATTVYVTHDQLEAMAMADTIALMNHGVVEQLGTPEDIYDRPASLFVADFIGSPPMSFLPFRSSVAPGDRTVRVGDIDIALPEVREGAADTELVLGVRPEHINLSEDAPLRAEVVDAEYLGTTQIVTLHTVTGARMKARIPADIRVWPGETTGLDFRPGHLSLFDQASGRALRTALHDGASMAELVMEEVTKRFGATTAVADLTLTVGDGEFLVLLGPTGAGKTTTLRVVAGLERADAGRVRLGGRDVTREPPAARDTTFVFQQYSLYPHLTVFDNLAFPLRSPAHREPEARIRARVAEVAELLHIEDKLSSRATQLSGGQMQRVAIGRALVRCPSIYLMDEPLSSLDAKLRAELRVELKRIQRELGATILYVTHDQTEAMTLATHIGVLDRGRLVQFGSPRAIYADPVNVYVATRLGSPGINLIPRRLYPDVQAPVDTATIGVRTEHVRIRKSANGHAVGRVKWIEHLGDQNHLHVTIADTEVVTLCDRDAGLAVGDTVDVELAAPLFFAANGERVRVG